MDWIRIIDTIESKFPDKSISKLCNVRSQYISDLKSGKSKNPGSEFTLKLIKNYNLNPSWLLNEKLPMFLAGTFDDQFSAEESASGNAAEQLKTIRLMKNLSQRKLAELLEISPSTIATIESAQGQNRRDIPKAAMRALVEKMNVNAHWLLTGQGPMFIEQDDEHSITGYRIPVLKQKASAGPGQDWQGEENIERYLDSVLDLSASFRKIKPYAFEVRGGSMAGAGIHSGDIVIFDPHPAELPDDIYVYALDGSVFVKYIVFDDADKTITTYSCMPDGVHKQVAVIHPDDPADAERFHLFGRVIAWLHENHLMRR